VGSPSLLRLLDDFVQRCGLTVKFLRESDDLLLQRHPTLCVKLVELRHNFSLLFLHAGQHLLQTVNDCVEEGGEGTAPDETVKENTLYGRESGKVRG